MHHLDANDLAALADGREPADAAVSRHHLATCRVCLAAYAEAVRIAHARAATPSDLAVPQEFLAAALAAGTAGARQRKPQRPVWRHRALASGALATVAVVTLTFSVVRDRGPDGATLALVEAALSEQSASSLVFPGVATPVPSDVPVYRSGAADTESLDRAMRELAQRLGPAPRDPLHAFWLGAGYLSSGQLGTALDLIRVARQTHPHDQRLLILDAIAAYRASELARAESLLREALRQDDRDPVARFDLAVVLAEAGRAWEAREILAAGQWSSQDELSRRAVALRDTLR